MLGFLGALGGGGGGGGGGYSASSEASSESGPISVGGLTFAPSGNQNVLVGVIAVTAVVALAWAFSRRR